MLKQAKQILTDVLSRVQSFNPGYKNVFVLAVQAVPGGQAKNGVNNNCMESIIQDVAMQAAAYQLGNTSSRRITEVK